MRKTYLLDTSVLVYDPCTWKQFSHCDVVIPMAVLNELDKLKKQSDEVGRNARVCIRLLDEISEKGDISTGILLDNDILLQIDALYTDISDGQFGDPNYGDSQILCCLVRIHNNHSERDVTLVSNDINLRVKAKARCIEAISHEKDKYSVTELYAGVQIIEDEETGLELASKGVIDPRLFGLHLHPHECVLFQGVNGDGLAMGRKVAPDKLRLVKKHYPWNIQSRNKEQTFLIDLIMDRNIDLVTVLGQAGTGKSLITLATALELVINKREYDKLIIYRPIQVVGKDIGYLPGLLEEKLAPHFVAIMDNLEILLSNKSGSDWKRDLEMFQKKGRIEMEAITFIRGRSIPNAIMLVDESQNLSGADIKTILTRAGENTKIILTGDIEQIDATNLDAMSNGLTNTIEKFKSLDIAGHITLVKGERSRLADAAAHIL
jgi:PhoH-like ATPase